MLRAADVRSILRKTALTAVSTGLLGIPLRTALVRAGLFDVPNHRSSHSSPVPRAGGLAPVLAATTTSLIHRPRPNASVAGAILGLAALGLADDINGYLPPTVRLCGQFVAGALLDDEPSRVLSSLGTAGIVNVVNFMDGINGISGGTALVWGANAIALAGELDDVQLAHLGALALGGALGFLPHNVPTARFFLGDTGSYALGGLLAAGVLSQRRIADRWAVAAPLLLYGLDASQALVHRVRTNQPVGVAHRDHVYQRLVDRGYSHIAVATFHTGMAALLAASHRLPLHWHVLLTCGIAGGYLCAPNVTTSAGLGRGRA